MKGIIVVFMFAGSYVGSFVPVIWGGSLLSVSSILLGAVGGLAGIWVGYKIARKIGVE